MGKLAVVIAAFILASGCAHAGMTRVKIANGQTIRCDVRFCDQFVALVADLCEMGHCPKSVICFALHHKPGSNHDGGGACDIDQRGRNKTSKFMYHSGALIKKHGLFDGCSFRDCGHVEGLRGLCNYGQCDTISARRHKRRRLP